MLSYREAKELVSTAKSFGEIKLTIENTNVSIFSYHFCSIKDFHSTQKAKWMRGITFIENDKHYDVYPMFPKFFNVNECEFSQFTSLKELTIESVTNKRDGSLVMPIILEGKVVFKTMKSFNNKQSRVALNIYSTNSHIKSFIDTYINDYSLLFEFTSPKNKIVLEYTSSEITLIGVVNRSSGKIMKFSTMKEIVDGKFPVVEEIKVTDLNTLMEMKKTSKGIEGWVITFTSGLRVKIKTDEYINGSKLFQFSDSLTENHIIKNILKNTIDDLIPSITNEDKVEEVKIIREKTMFYVENLIEEVDDELSIFINGFKCDKKEFLLSKKKGFNDEKFINPIHILLMSVGSKKKFSEQQIKDNILNNITKVLLLRTSKVKTAQLFLSEIENKRIDW